MEENMKKYLMMSIMFILALIIAGGILYGSNPEEGSIYGHISYIEGNPKVIRADQTQEDGVVNLPIAPGDVVLTNDNSRCELQFDNGTVMRLDKQSRLKVVTVLAKSLTSNWKITTLELQEGKLYSINQSYNRECFQVVTPNAAINLKNNSMATIMLKGGESHLACDRGKFDVMYGGEIKNLQADTVHKGESYIVNADNKFLKNEKRDIDFLAWNQYINNNFKELHYGVNKVPKKIYKYSKGLVTWAEKWSSLVGEWIYDDLFGYVWKPLDPRYAHPGRLFLNATYTTINGQTFLVPNEPWGWVPSHMGTWVWMKWGWTWIPGNAFTPGIDWFGAAEFGGFGGFDGFLDFWGFGYSSLYYWMDRIYGGFDYYYIYRNHGIDHWRMAYEAKFKKTAPNPSYKGIPKEIHAIFKKMDGTPVTGIQSRLGKLSPEIEQAIFKAPIKEGAPVQQLNSMANHAKQEGSPANLAKPAVPVEPGLQKAINTNPANIINTLRYSNMVKSNSVKDVRAYRDWNPDKAWAFNNGVKVQYSSKTNEVVCPNLGLRSSQISQRQMNALTMGSQGQSNSRGFGSLVGSDSGGPSHTMTGSNSGGPTSFSSSKGGDSGGKGQEKKD
ncbi:MAG: FecR protein [Acidobacteriota bacterium]|nr:FecR protein [Acidobacteriota bacterium]